MPLCAESGIGFKLAFGDYMEGKALSTQAYYWAKSVSENKPRSREERDQAHETLSKVSELYSQAADKFPKDDEWYCSYKKYSLIQLFLNGDPLSLTLPLTDSILHDLPLGQTIWRWSSNNVEGELDGYAQLEDFQDAVREATEAGQIPPGSDIGVSPPWADPSIIFGKEATIQSHF
ncbi:hypothetical protein PENSPDRAFT_693525 [Peniophora sp. CONT]|nr:hypothetical protein PENSPDRAFT_693525 [Peniophora sp. CONT]